MRGRAWDGAAGTTRRVTPVRPEPGIDTVAQCWTLPAVLLAGSVFREGVRVQRAALHAGDWLITLIAIGAIVSFFR